MVDLVVGLLYLESAALELASLLNENATLANRCLSSITIVVKSRMHICNSGFDFEFGLIKIKTRHHLMLVQ